MDPTDVPDRIDSLAALEALFDAPAEPSLRKETRVASYRLGAWNEGGTGVTVVELE